MSEEEKSPGVSSTLLFIIGRDDKPPPELDPRSGRLCLLLETLSVGDLLQACLGPL